MTELDQTFRLIAEHSADTILRVAPDHSILYASPACNTLLGYTPDEMVHLSPPQHLIHPEDLGVLASAIENGEREESDGARTTMRWIRSDGSTVWVEANARVLREPNTAEPVEFILTLRDITERKALEDQLARLAHTDALTGLANRRAFDVTLEREWQRTLRDGTPTSLLLLDLDHFKQLNDRYGHQVGDDCLRAAARAITTAVRRTTDFAARYGGEELAVILPTVDYDDALEIADSICRAVADLRIPHPGNTEGNGFVSVSVGVATALSRHGGTMRMPESLLIAADTALYKAKNNGRNQANGVLLLAPAP